MVQIVYGGVREESGRKFDAYPRFVALLDVLGMKSWLQNDSAARIASELDGALINACAAASTGTRLDTGRTWGPLIETVSFSDTVFAWSPDDSWVSLGLMCAAIGSIVAFALNKGVPLRGAVALGEAVCAQKSLVFVGQPIAEAYQWSERTPKDGGRPYRSVGVDITPQTISRLKDRLRGGPYSGPLFIHPYPGRTDTTDEDVFLRKAICSPDLIWYRDCLFVNHWKYFMHPPADMRAMMLKRISQNKQSARTSTCDQLGKFESGFCCMTDDQSAIMSKVREAEQFYEYARSNQFDYAGNHQSLIKNKAAYLQRFNDQLQRFNDECMRLETLRIERTQ